MEIWKGFPDLKNGMSGFLLKVIALFAMTVDHIGFHLLESDTTPYFVCRAVGRIALPLYCYLIAEGYRHTKDRKRYFLRLGFFAILIELGIYILYLYSGSNYLIRVNIFLTLSTALACLILMKSPRTVWKLCGLGILSASCILSFDYGVYAVLLVLLFGYTERFLLQVVGMLAINVLFIGIIPLFEPIILLSFSTLQWYSMFALVCMYFYNGREGRHMKHFFYLYYPLHLLVIWAVKVILET